MEIYNARMFDWRARIMNRIKERGSTMEGVSLAAGRNKSYVQNILKPDGSSPTLEKLDPVLRALNWSWLEFIGDASLSGLRLTIKHRILANEMWVDKGAEEPTELPLSFLADNLVSLEIETDEYRSSGYRRGDVVSGVRSIGPSIDNYVNSDCIVETVDGDKYFKVLKKGTVPGRYDLRSMDPTLPDLENMEIRWAASVKLIFRGIN